MSPLFKRLFLFSSNSGKKDSGTWVKLAIVSLVIVLLCIYLPKADNKIYDVNDLNLQKREQMSRAKDAFDRGDSKDALLWLNMVVYDAENLKPGNDADIKDVADAYLMLGDIYSGKKGREFVDQGKAYTYYRKADKYADKYNLIPQKAKAMLGIGSRYEIFLSIDDNEALTDSLVNILSRGLDYAIKAQDAATASSSMDVMAECVYPLNKADKITKELNDYSIFTKKHANTHPELLYTLNVCRTMEALSSGRPEEALLISDEMLENEDQGNSLHLIKILSLRAQILYQLGRNKESFETFNKVATIAEELDDKWILMQVYKILNLIYDKEGEKEKSQDAYASYLHIKEEILREEGISTIKDLHFMGELEDMNIQLQTLLIENKYAKIGFILISVVTVVFAILIFFLVRTKRKLKERNRRIYNQYQQILGKEGGIKLIGNINLSPEFEELNYKELSDKDREQNDNNEYNEEKEKLTRLSDNEMNSILERINRVLDDSDVALSPKFKLKDLAKETGESSRSVSQTINDKCGCNFSTFLAQYRINRACKMISNSPEFRRLTIEAMAESVGIQSRSYFSITFKKIVGLNPSEYIRQANLNS